MIDLTEIKTEDLITELSRRENIIKGALNDRPSNVIDENVALSFHITTNDLYDKSRRSDIATPRFVAMTLLRELGWSCQSSASRYGLHYSSAIHAVKKVDLMQSADPLFSAQLKKLRKAIADTLQPSCKAL